jgi:methyl-accepting chemotaxis protein
MKLKTQVLLASALTILVFFGVSEVLSYRQAAEFFAQHEMRIRQEGENQALLAAFKQEKQSLLWELAALRVLSAVGAAAALFVALHWLWGRLVSRPVNLLLDRINSMSRGTWTQPIPVERPDEIGRLVREFNLLGPRLTFVAHQFAAASKLAAMALIGQRVARRTDIARGRLVKIRELLSEAPYRSQAVPQAAVDEIGKVAGELAGLAADLESEFNDELARQGLPARSIHGEKGRASRAGPRHDESLAS